MTPAERSALRAAHRHARRARQLASAEGVGLSGAEYRAVLEDGPCVYCGANATEVDHVEPLSRGGHERLDNLVAACRSCNASKSNKLLTEWDPVRAAHGIACSPKVAAAWERLTGLDPAA